MKKTIVAKNPFGIFAFSNDELVYYQLFSGPEQAVKAMKEKTSKEFLDQLDSKNIKTNSTKAMELINRELIKDLKSIDDKEYNQYLTKFGILWSRQRMKKQANRDKLLIQATSALGDVNKTINLFSERLDEWFSLHYPEIRGNISAKDVVEYGVRGNYPKFSSSSGVELTTEDEEAVKGHAQFLLDLKNYKKELESYIKEVVEEIAPNFSSLLDSSLAAQLIAKAGGMQKIAKITSSSIQLLGAEKALFRHLKKDAKPPKYGLLYKAKEVQDAPKGLKGKVARLISAKLMVAARLDQYSDKDQGDKLKQQLKKEIKEAKE